MKKVLFTLTMVIGLFLFFSNLLPADEMGKGVKITYLGHSAFKFISPKGMVIYIDPYLTRNPKGIKISTLEIRPGSSFGLKMASPSIMQGIRECLEI